MRRLILFFFLVFDFTGQVFFSAQMLEETDAKVTQSMLSVTTGQSRYAVGEKISVTIKNESDQDVWLMSSCGTALYLLMKKDGDTWQSAGAYPTKDCYARHPKLAAREEVVIPVDPISVYRTKDFDISAGIYKFAVAFTKEDLNAVLAKGESPDYLQTFSNSFLIGDIGLNIDGTQRGGIIEDR